MNPVQMVTNRKLVFCLAIVLSGGFFGCSTTSQRCNWPVFYDCEKGPAHLLISRTPQSMDSYTNGIPDWNYDLRVPAAKISSAQINVLGEIDGLRVIEARIALADMYYTDTLMILEEVETGRFLPVYVQNYNHDVRWPSANVVVKERTKLIVNTGMDYAGTGHFHNYYKIIISPNHNPIVKGSFY